MNKLTILTGYDHFFGQTRKPWISMDVSSICKYLNKAGIDTEVIEFSAVVNGKGKIRNSNIFYTFSQRDNLRRYILDTITSLEQEGNKVLPSTELLRCHENKGYQVLFGKRMGINDLESFYFSSKRELSNYQLSFPIVIKTIDGSNGRGVFLANSQRELLEIIPKLEPRLSIVTKVDLLRRKHLRKNVKFPGYPNLTAEANTEQYIDYITPELPFILQEFVPKLEYDYRVIVFGERYYVIKRMIRDDDFRASGAKRFVFEKKVPMALLNYAYNIFTKLHAPFLSLDIGVSGDRLCLFEFQALHFGINAIVKSAGYYTLIDGCWVFNEETLPIEQLIADGLIQYLTPADDSINGV